MFLSYASQDAEEAKRIADALRAAGVEVWFDQSELRGGDSWDAAIRKQIKECALFVPIISAHTQERSEGYFRLEWHLAEQRTYLMAHDRPFLFPVVIDGTTDAEARVPEKFRERQWTRLDGRDTPESLARRIVTVLAGESPASATRSEPPAPSPRSAAPRARAGVPAWAWLLGVAGVAAITGFVLFRSRPPAE
ncbi:MAG TPA: toll/interleukin-1 receptor domain-containing protein, partial [Opitutaceae bacterium]